MAIIRSGYRVPTYAPWRELEEMSNRMGRLFEDSVSNITDGALWAPPVSVHENAEELRLTAELPGVRPEDVEIDMENNVLTVRGEKREEFEEGRDEGRTHVRERRYGAFQRTFTLPRTVKADDIRATFRDGVLTIHMPKAPEAKGRKISIATEA